MEKYLENIHNLIQKLFSSNFFASAFSLLLFIAIYTSLSFFIKRQDWSKEKKRRIGISIRNSIIFLFLITLIFLWGGGIKTLVLSAAAVCAAFFVAFKEVLLSFFGTLSSNRLFSIGDYIEYDGYKGRIVDKNFLNTRIVVLDTHQSKELVFPNMNYITNRIINMSRLGKYQAYTLTISVEKTEDLYIHAQKAMEIAQGILEPFEQDFKTYFSQKSTDNIFFETPPIKPVLTFDLSDSKKPCFKLNYISHPLDNSKIEQHILTSYLRFCQEYKNEDFAKSIQEKFFGKQDSLEITSNNKEQNPMYGKVPSEDELNQISQKQQDKYDLHPEVVKK